MFIPPPANHSGKIGFPTYAMWGLCVVVVGVCYVLESKLDDGVPATKAMPAEVHKVLPSGALLMSARAGLTLRRARDRAQRRATAAH